MKLPMVRVLNWDLVDPVWIWIAKSIEPGHSLILNMWLFSEQSEVDETHGCFPEFSGKRVGEKCN